MEVRGVEDSMHNLGDAELESCMVMLGAGLGRAVVLSNHFSRKPGQPTEQDQEMPRRPSVGKALR